MVGTFSNICLGQCGRTAHKSVIEKEMIFTLTAHLHHAENSRGVTVRLDQGAHQLPLSSCFPSAKLCVVKGLQPSKRPQK